MDFRNINYASEAAYPTPLSNSSLLPLLLLSLSMQKHAPSSSASIKDEYDFVVVGGGPAGSVIASRLSEMPCVTVLLLEAGPEPPLLTEVPGLCRFFRGTNLDWKYKTTPQKYAAIGFPNRQMPWSTGKMLGGSASYNGMAYVRGNRKDYDHWVELGAEGWSYKDIFKYFLKLEDNRTPAFLADGYHALGGPISVEQPRYYPELKLAASEAALGMGYQFVDSNGARQTGFYDAQVNYRDNQRCSPVKGYLVPAEERKNLDISLNSFVTRIIFKDNQAVGVEFYNGKYQRVKVKREIIMTAGAFNTPQILMLSGIGPRDELNKFNIPIVADLPVGKNFHDHGGTSYLFTMDPSIRGFSDKLSDPASTYEYITQRSGPLSSEDNVLLAFLYKMDIAPSFDFPNYEIYFGELDDLSPKKFGLKDEVYKKFLEPYENKAIFRCNAQGLHTRSRGTIKLNSSNPFDPPLIDPNYFEDPRDLEDVVDALKICKKVLASEPMRRLDAKPFQTILPGCERFIDDEDDYLRCYTRTFTFAFHHAVGSTKMGNPSDSTTVVDPELRVKGIKGLRVADASVMPQVTSGNTHIPVIMIAEKASDMIKDTISCGRTCTKYET